MPRKKGRDPCCIEGCTRQAAAHGVCQTHYMRWVRTGTTDVARERDGRRSHPLYSIWFERKQRGSLCPEWAGDIFVFAAAVGTRPSRTHLLRRKDTQRPYGPENWEWFPGLKRQPGETKKAFDARKWADRRRREPEYEHRRWLKRRYGLTVDEFEELLAAQDGKCAICRQEETAHHAKTGNVRQLAVDHCHTTGKIRGLLCYRCNATLGRVDESADLLRAMVDYLAAWA